jgi:hypothetical protein
MKANELRFSCPPSPSKDGSMKKKLKSKRAANKQKSVSANGATSANSNLKERSERTHSSDHIPNEETARVLRDAQEGKNLLNYGNLEEMFEDLGI